MEKRNRLVTLVPSALEVCKRRQPSQSGFRARHERSAALAKNDSGSPADTDQNNRCSFRLLLSSSRNAMNFVRSRFVVLCLLVFLSRVSIKLWITLLLSIAQRSILVFHLQRNRPHRKYINALSPEQNRDLRNCESCTGGKVDFQTFFLGYSDDLISKRKSHELSNARPVTATKRGNLERHSHK